jgi:phage shock protein A
LLTEVAEKYKTLPGQSDLYEERSTEAAQMLAESESRVAALEQDLNTFLEAKKQAVVLSAVRHQRERSLQTAIEDLRKRGKAFYDAKNYVRAVQEWESVLALIESHDLSPAPEWIDELVAEVKGDIASASAHLEK